MTSQWNIIILTEIHYYSDWICNSDVNIFFGKSEKNLQILRIRCKFAHIF